MKRIIRFFREFTEQFMKADVVGLSAQLAYFFLLSLFPFLLFLITLLGYLPLDELSLLDFIATYAPQEIVVLLESNLRQLVNQQNTGLLSIGIIGTLWSASNGVNAITKALNKAYDVTKTRPFFIARLIAIALTIAMIVVISIALILPVFGKMIGVYTFSLFGLSENFLTIWNAFRWIISSIILFLVLVSLYTMAPFTRVYLRVSIWGALFATIGWQLVSLIFSYYVSTLGNYSATYGSLGTVIILMIWFYISGIIIITGGVINSVLQKKLKKE